MLYSIVGSFKVKKKSVNRRILDSIFGKFAKEYLLLNAVFLMSYPLRREIHLGGICNFTEREAGILCGGIMQESNEGSGGEEDLYFTERESGVH